MSCDPIRVLLVDDDEDDYLLTTSLLEDVADTDYEVTWVTSADEAIRWLEARAHDVCLLDYHLGADTGIDVLRTIARRSTVPCVLLTGQANQETDRAAMDAGAVDYLIKGQFDEQHLERAIRYAIENAIALRSLRESEERFRSVVEAATDGIALLGADGAIVTCNRAMEDVFSASPGTLHGCRFLDLLATHDDEVSALLASGDVRSTMQVTAAESVGRRADASTFPLEISLSTWETEGSGRYWSVIVRDVTERKALADRLVHQAQHDPLTGLANRTLLRDRVAHAIDRLGRTDGSVALLFLDLDDFKRVNDTFGHEVGDELLTNVAARLMGCVRNDEIVARLGGDEFAVCLEGLSEPSVILRLADRIVRAMEPSFHIRGRPIAQTCSIGIAITDRVGCMADELLRHADIAMYAAKGSGKNRYEVFEDSMHGEMVERVRMESDLRAAVHADEVTLAYQPIVALGSLDIVGFEALARWDCRNRGPVSPAVFISVAEESGLIHEFGRMALRKGMLQLAEWHALHPDRTPIKLAVNLSSRQLTDPGLVQFVGDLLDETGLERGTFTLEVTETVMVGDVDQAIGVLQKLRELGVQLALDDFGTGYSSLSYLHLLPLDVVKVDQSFIARIDDETGASMVRAIAAIGQSLGFELVAEGIEAGTQLRFLTEAGYRYGQGFLFSKPVDAFEATAMLEGEASFAGSGGEFDDDI